MPSSFVVATDDLNPLAQELIKKYHLDLGIVAVKIDFLFVFRDPDGEAPAIIHQGVRALGLASIIKLKDRVKGMGDCEIQIDGDAWNEMSSDSQSALLDHELEHFEVKRHAKTGDILWDDISRPLLKIRQHDRDYGWFDKIAIRHGKASHEVRQMTELIQNVGRTYLPQLRNGVISIEDLPEQKEDEESQDSAQMDHLPSAEDMEKNLKSNRVGLAALAERLRQQS